MKGRNNITILYKFGFAISVSPEKDNVAKLINLKSYRRVPFQPVIEELAGKENIELNNILFASPVCHFAKEYIISFHKRVAWRGKY